MGIVYALLILTGLILIHELGHFLAAKIFNVQILEFAIGMGPKLLGIKRKGIEYRFNVFPIGGYVRLAGEDISNSIESLDVEIEKDKLLYEKPAWQRMVISAAGPIASILTGYIIMILTFGIWGVSPVKVERVVPNSPAQEAGIIDGDIIHSVNGRRIFDTNEFSKAVNLNDILNIELLRNKVKLSITVTPRQTPEEIEMLIEIAKKTGEPDKLLTINGIKPSTEFYNRFPNLKGQTVKLEFENGIVEGRLIKAFYTPPRKTVGIYFSNLSPRIQKGFDIFEAGDVLTSINGYKIKDGVDLSRIISLLDSGANKVYLLNISGDSVFYQLYSEFDKTVEVEVKRKGNLISFNLPREQLLDLLTSKLIFSPSAKPIREGILEVIRDGIERTNRIIAQMGEIVAMLFTGKLGLSSLSGPIGIVAFVGNVSRYGFEPMLFLTVLITLNLGLINFIPLPALDGGRIVFAFLEIVTRKKLDPAIESYVHFVGFMILMALMVYITYIDIMRLVG